MPYFRILSRLYNVPLAISEAKLDIISSNITTKLLENVKPSSLLEVDSSPRSKVNYPVQNGVAVIPVFDSLVARNGAGDSGVRSYEGIQRDTLSAIEAGAKTIVYNIDSPGGEVAGLFGMTDFISRLPRQYGVQTIGVSDSYACSAAYAIMSSCQKAYATETATLGSIGVIATLVNTSKLEEKAGVEYTIIRSKDEKALLNPHEPFPSKAIEDLQNKMTAIDNEMMKRINSYRPNLSIASMNDMNGKTYLGGQAVQLNLVDGIINSFDELYSSLAVSSKKSQSLLMGKNMNLDEALAEVTTLRSELATLKSSNELAIAQAKKEEQARATGIIDAALTFNMGMDIVKKRIEAGTSVNDVVEMFGAIKEAIQMANPSPAPNALSGTLNSNVVTSATDTNEDTDYLSGLLGAVEKITSANANVGGVR